MRTGRRTGSAAALLSGGLLGGTPPADAVSAWTGEGVGSGAVMLQAQPTLMDFDLQLARDENPSPMHGLLVSVISEVHSFWSKEWAASGFPAPDVAYRFPAPGERVPVPVGCTADGSGLSNDATAQYCWIDDSIVISQAIAERIDEGDVEINADSNDQHPTGNFSVAYVVAHEYAHNLQPEAGGVRGTATGPNGRHRMHPEELHADCWAGVWARSAFDQGKLERGDIREAVQTTMDFGDYEVWASDHHGTPAQRRTSFLAGFLGRAAEACRHLLAGRSTPHG